MKTAAFVLVPLIAVSAMAQHIQLPADSGSTGNRPQLRTIVGCLSRNVNFYVITGGGPGPRQYRIIGGNTSALNGKRGHTLEVVGLVGKNDPVENIITPYNAGTTTGVGYNTVVVQKVRDIYQNCSELGNEYPGDHK